MSLSKEVGQLKGGQLDMEWEIADFLSLSTDVNESYHSPTYFFGDTSWYIEVYPNGSKYDSSEGWIGLYVCKGDSGPPVTATFRLFLKKKGSREAMCNKEKDTFNIINDGWGRAKALKRSDLINRKWELMPSGSLTIVCMLKFGNEQQVKVNKMLKEVLNCYNMSTEACTETEKNSDIKNIALAAAVQDMKVLRDFKALIVNGDSCDITLQVKGQKFDAHQTILRARSPVFASMLSHDMKEKNTGLIDIADCDPEYFPDFLSFLYCGSVESITLQNMCSLFRAADKYHVEDLKSECLAFIKSHLDVDNFCDVITLALQLTQADLIKQTTDFFIQNALKVVVTVKWQVFLAENPTESNELIIKAFSANKSSNP